MSDRVLKQFEEALLSVKAFEIEFFTFPEQGRYFESCFVCSGSSHAHVRGIAEKTQQEMKKLGITPLGVEGLGDLNWVLLDYDQVLIHIFLEEIRSDYNLGALYRMWQTQAEKRTLEARSAPATP